MAIVTHDSKWRLLIGAAPLVGIAFMAWAALQGEGEAVRSPTLRATLAGVAALAALGALVAWGTSRQRRAATGISVARACALAQAGELPPAVVVSGRAQALPDAMPLLSPNGELCLWFRPGERLPLGVGTVDGVSDAESDSAWPFLLVDDSGPCIVLPAGAQVSGGAHPEALGWRGAERLLRSGDRVRVAGRFVPVSAEAFALQAQAVARAARVGLPRLAVQDTGRGAAPALALPVLAAPGGTRAFSVRIGPDDGAGDLYGLLALADVLVLVAAASLGAWSLR